MVYAKALSARRSSASFNQPHRQSERLPRPLLFAFHFTFIAFMVVPSEMEQSMQD